jgi:hypothetical protein
MCWAIQNLSGNSFSNYSTYFLQQAGLDESKAYYFALGQYAINSVGVFGAWGLITLGYGRRRVNRSSRIRMVFDVNGSLGRFTFMALRRFS